MKQLELCSFWLHGIIVPSFLFTRNVSGEGNKRKHPTSFFNQFPIVSLPHPIHCDVLASSVRTGAHTLTATVGYIWLFFLLLLLWWYKLINGFWMRGLALHYDDITYVYLPYMIQLERERGIIFRYVNQLPKFQSGGRFNKRALYFYICCSAVLSLSLHSLYTQQIYATRVCSTRLWCVCKCRIHVRFFD